MCYEKLYEIGNYASATVLPELTPEHMCGKAVKES